MPPRTAKKKRTAAKKPAAKKKVARSRKARLADDAALKRQLRRLDRLYPDADCALEHENPWQLLIATILSAQCTDVAVNKATPSLFAKYPTPADLGAAPQPEVEDTIKSIGLFRNKAKALHPDQNRDDENAERGPTHAVQPSSPCPVLACARPFRRD